MAYRVNYFDPNNTNAVIVQDATQNKDTHLTLLGKNWYGYGEVMAENLLHLMENFASTEANKPNEAQAVPGQLWFKKIDTNTDSLTDDGVFYYFDGNTVSDPVGYPYGQWKPLRLETISSLTIKDQDTGNLQTVTAMFDEGEIISVTSSEDFDVHVDDPYFDQFNNNFAGGKRIRAGITLRDGMLFQGTATSAQYADLAEYYSSDAEYEPGTVLKIGGEAEVTQTTTAFCPDVFGVVSTDPAYLMNSNLGGTRVAVALEGRVPVKVIGQVKKGQRLLSSEEPGVARAPTDYEMQEYMDWYRIVGRALEDKTTEGIGLVEVAVGVK